MLLYGSELWGCIDPTQIESVHLYACKRLMKVAPRTPNQMVYGELGRYPLSILASLKSVKYWLRLMKLPNTRYAKMAYQMMVNMDERGHETWVTRLKILLFENGFAHVWYNGGVGSENVFLRKLRTRLTDCFAQNWHAKLEDSSRYQVYRSFKSDLVREKYFHVVQTNYVRVMYSKFRLGITQLKTNKLRYINTDSEVNKKCDLCNLAVENEYHMLFVCPFYQDLRCRFLGKYFDLDSFINQRMEILNTENPSRIRSLASFVFHALKLRREITGDE